MNIFEEILTKIPNPSVMLAIFLVFITSVYAVISNIYINTLFLSTYPVSWLIYFLVILSLFTAFIGLIIAPLFAKKTKENCILILKMIVLMMIILVAIKHLNFYWIPFIISIGLGTMSAVIPVIAWSIIPLAFNIREYKNIARLGGVSAAVGSIIGSFAIPIQLKFLPLDSILYLLALITFVITLNVYLLPLLKEKLNPKLSEQTSPLKYPLFCAVLIFLICIITTQSLIDYIFKFEAAKHYSGSELGSFFGIFSGLTNILGLFLGLSTLKYVMKRFSLNGILYATPLFTLIACIVVIILPSIWTVCILASMRSLFYFNFTTLSSEIALNILPTVVRAKAKFQLKTIFTPFTTLVVFLLVMVFAKKTGIVSITLVIAVIAIYAIYMVHKVTDAYQKSLQSTTDFKRFNVLDQSDGANQTVLQKMIESSFASSDSTKLILGLSLINSSTTSQLPTTIFLQLNHPLLSVRKSIINLIRQFKATEGLEHLVDQFAIEDDIETKFLLLNTIRLLDPAKALNYARGIIKDSSGVLYPAAVNILIECGNLEEKAHANNALYQLVQSENLFSRREVVKIIGRLVLVDFKQALNKLITDEDDIVSCEAISAAARCNLIDLAPIIVKQIQRKSRAATVHKALGKLGVSVIPYLIADICTVNNPTLLIRALNSISGNEKDQSILEVMKTGSVFIRHIVAKEINAKACLIKVSHSFKKNASVFAFEEALYFSSLSSMLLKQSEHYLLAEIKSRQQLVKISMLYWLAVASDPVKINQLIPSLIHSTNDVAFAQAQAKAIELLEIYIKDKALLACVINVFEPTDPQTLPSAHQEYNDAWLARLINANFNQGEDMDLLSKVFDLRGVELFKDLPAEILIAIAEETERLSFEEGESVFLENDRPDGLYCISSGEVRIERQGKVLTILKEHDYFGELALIDDTFRTADAFIQSDASLLFLSKETFDRITDDIPEVLRTVVKVILNYLRQKQ